MSGFHIFAKSTNTVWKNRPEQRERAESNGESEIPPKNMDGVLGKIHEMIYPPNSEYYWYRWGKIGHDGISVKYIKFALMSAFVGICGSGVVVGFFIYILHLIMQYLYSGPLHWGVPAYVTESELDIIAHQSINTSSLAKGEDLPIWVSLASNPLFCFIWMLCSGTSTLAVYVFGAEWYRREFYVKRFGKDEEWKCQPYRYLNDDNEREEAILGCTNAFLAGFAGLGLFFINFNHPFLLMYYDLSRGYFHFFRGLVIVFLWIDIWSYWTHRLLHVRWFYLRIHKWHHRYQAPTAYSAFAMSPWEFLMFQSAGVCCMAFFEVHVAAFLGAVSFIAYHNQVDHSGIHFEAEVPWCPSSKYHDDHHKLFHLNFGVQLVVWDWLFGTLRKKNRVYSEENYVGNQDSSATPSTKKDE